MVTLQHRRKAFRQTSSSTPSPTTDPYFSNVVLLMHCDGANNATSTTDSSSSNKSITFGGDAKLNTTDPKFGTTSLLLDGSGDYLSLADSNDWDFSGDFTMECWIKFTTGSDASTIFSNYNNANGFTFRYNNTSLCLEFLWGNSVIATNSAGSWVPTNGVWQHFAVCRVGTSLKMFVDGVQQGSTVTTNTDFSGSAIALHIGCLPYSLPTRVHFLNGRIDEIRITKGVGRYSSNFLPPFSSLPNS